MKRRMIVSMLLISAMLFATGCAKKEVVKKDELLVPSTSQKTAEVTKEAPAPTSVVPSTSSSKGNPATDAVASSSSLQAKAVYFGFDEYVLTNESRNTLQSNFTALEKKPSIQIEGHCDERGSAEYNLALGEKRAKAAQSYLVTLGYPADNVATISYGKERPAVKGSDEAAWAKNRRDEFRIVK
jgi:peptidoglycan-associated lipoprotein